MSYINIDNLPEEEREKYKPYIISDLEYKILSEPKLILGDAILIHTMRKEVFEKLETIRLILEDNKIKLTTDELLDEIVSSELEKTKKFIKN